MNHFHAQVLTWTGLVYGVVFLLMLFGLLLMWTWPRNPDGTRMNFEDAMEVMERAPKTPGDGSPRLQMFMVAIIVTVGLAMSQTGLKHSQNHDPDD